jgi:exopolysaccharide production protein ExoQ
MTPNVALVACLFFIACCIYIVEKEEKHKILWSLWIPLIWICILGSRNVSLFINYNAGLVKPEDYLEGSPLDRFLYGILIFLSIIVLLNRDISWTKLVASNKWLALLFLYCGISIIWSDYQFISVKRYIKAIGNVLIALIIVTDRNPEKAFNVIIKRLSIILIPLSVVFYKYFPEIGRIYHRYSGELMITGVTTNKNALGTLCLITSIFFISSNYYSWKDRKMNTEISIFNTSVSDTLTEEGMLLSKKIEYLINTFIFASSIWLLIASNSSTPDVCLIIGLIMMVILGFKWVRKDIKLFKKIMLTLFVFCSIFIVIFFDVFHLAINMTGHQETFWGRVSFWPELIKISNGTILFGVGYDSFWLGERLELIWSRYWWKPTEAHNGYVEIFLELGLVGICFYIIVFIASINKIFKNIEQRMPNSNLFMILFIMIILYNITETAFKGTHIMWFMFLLISINYENDVLTN